VTLVKSGGNTYPDIETEALLKGEFIILEIIVFIGITLFNS